MRERISRAMHPARTARGYCGIGAEGVSKSANVGALLRTAHAFGAAFCFTIGAGWDARAGRRADTADTPAHVPLWRFPDAAALQLPRECVLVGVELLEDAVDLPSFRHPLNAAYVLGPERSGLSDAGARAVPARGPHPDPVRAQSRGGRRAGAVRPAAAARALRRAPGRQRRAGRSRSRRRPATATRASGAPIPDWLA